MGGSPVAALINLATYAGILSGVGIMGFGLMCAFDFERRTRAASLLEGALSRPDESKVQEQHQPLGGFDIYAPSDMSA